MTRRASEALIAVGRVHVVDDLALIPDVVAGGDDIDAEFEQFFGDLRRDAEAAGGVLTVGDGEVNRVLLLQFGQPFMHDGAARTPEDVTDEENAQGSVAP